MRLTRLQQYLLGGVLVAVALLVGGVVAAHVMIQAGVESAAAKAQRNFPEAGDDVAALIRYVQSDRYTFRERNYAVWALGRLGDPRSLPVLEAAHTGEQCDHARVMARSIAGLTAAGWRVVVVHGNGPQVGALAVQQHMARDEVPPHPLFSLVAMTQGEIGSILALALRERLGTGPPGVVSVGSHVIVHVDDPAFARKALQAGARAFVLKEAADEELLEAIRLAANGDTYLNPRVGAAMATAPTHPPVPPDHLSEREVEVLRLIAFGHTNAEIAQQLFLSTRTVETHRAHIQQKLGRTSRAELVRYALEHHLVKV